MEISQINWVFILTGACASMAILAVLIMTFVVHYQKKVIQYENEKQLQKLNFQADLMQANLIVEESERSRISKNMHDEVGVYLSLIKMNVTSLQRSTDIIETDKEKLRNTVDIIDKTMLSTRTIVKDLQSPLLRDYGFIIALSDLCQHVNSSNELSIQFTTIDSELRFDTQTELQLFRLSQEIINNIIKHSRASTLQINLGKTTTELTLLFEHNGKGITDEELDSLMQKGKGNGLKNILSRLQFLGASQTLLKSDSLYTHLIKIPAQQ